MAEQHTVQVVPLETAEARFTALAERLHATMKADLADERSRVDGALTQVDQSLTQVRADLHATAARITAPAEQAVQGAALTGADHRMNDYVVARIQMCDGKSTQAVRTWLADMQSAQGYLPTNREVMTAVLRTTTGPLAREIDTFLADRQASGLETNRLDVSWQLVERLTRTQFLPANDLLYLQDQLLSMRQCPGDSVSLYSRRFRELAQTAFPIDTRSADVNDRLIDTYLSGLVSQQIMYDVKVTEPSTVEEAISKVEKRNRALECLQRSLARRTEEPMDISAVSTPPEEVAAIRQKSPTPKQDALATIQQAVAQLTAKVDQLSTTSPDPPRTHGKGRITNPRAWTADGRPVCYECGKAGHLARSCLIRLRRNSANNRQVGQNPTRHTRPRPPSQPRPLNY